MKAMFPKLRFALLAATLLWIKTYIIYKLVFDIKTANAMQEFILCINPLSSLLLFIGLALFADKKRNRLILLISFLLSVLLLANAIFYGFFNDFMTLPVLFQTNNIPDLGTSIQELITYKILLMFGDVLILWFINRLFPNFGHKEKLNRNEKSAFFLTVTSIFIINLVLAETQHPQLLSRSFDRKTIVKNLGLYNYQIYDIALQSRSSAQHAFASSNEFAEIENYATTKEKEPNKALFGIAKNKNVIIISMESTQSFAIGNKVNGKEVTPFLNEFIKESYSFTNFYHQTGQGKTSDAEFIIENSLYPLDRGSVFFTHYANEFTATPEILKDYGYYSAVFHSNNKSFWNRDLMYPSLGYSRYFNQNDYIGTQQNSVGWGLKDKEFFEQSIPKLKALPQPFYTKFITLTNHFPFILDEKDRLIDEYNSESEILNRYFPTVRYTDEAIKYFVKRLKEEGLYDNTIIVIYGDHYGISENHNAALAQFLGKDQITPYDSMQLQRVPLIIHIPGQKGGTISKIAGQIDVKPTLLHLLGVSTNKTVEFGTDLFTEEANPIVVMRDGSFVTNRYVFTKNICYSKETKEPIEAAYCTPYAEKAKAELQYSDKIIYGDLLRFDQSNQHNSRAMTTAFE
ncbi:LTA synthase family protein [Bacillus sp. 165]|uniref:LTA synthase family protein n=1 Tax=Bacillus sp. 165 TaxID=1529117 RepID=UPI001ADC3148|nr:LTA synthase family protein [Bacillus sp. 165]MBO9128349.1 LTA synthase family protein [Bacillus sp. 165]